jgi:SAM-dependent methyltransferase
MWNEKFNRKDYLYGTQPNDFLKSVSTKLPEKSRILCIGEGEGRNATYLAECGHQVTAVDASEIGLKKAQKLATKKGVTIQTEVCDLREYDLKTAHWDAIVAIFCHLPKELRKHVHKHIPSSLKTGGLFIMEAYHPDQIERNTGGPKDLNLLISATDIENELDSLKWLHLEELEREIIEGTGHTGNGIVTQAIGQK